MDTAGRQRHSPLGMLCLPRPGVLPVFAALSFAAVIVLLTMFSRLHLELLQSKNDPYHHEYAGLGVEPLLGDYRMFDVGVSVFAFKPINVTARPECAPLADARWIANYSGPQLRRVSPDGSEAERELIHLAKQVNMVHPERSASACNLLYVPETEELWSGTVAHNMTHSDKHLRAFLDVDIPAQFLKPLRPLPSKEALGEHDMGFMIDTWRANNGPNLYAVVTLIPHLKGEKALRSVTWYKHGLADLPLVGSAVLEQAEKVVNIEPHKDDHDLTRNYTDTELRREYLSTMSVRAPLLYHQLSASRKRADDRFMTTKVLALLLKNKGSLGTATNADRLDRMLLRGCSAPPWKTRHRLLCRQWNYAEMGHSFASYELGRPGFLPGVGALTSEHIYEAEMLKRRYPPYLTTARPGPLDYNVITVGNETHQRHSFEVQLSVVDHVRLAYLERARHREGWYPRPADPGEGNTKYVQIQHDGAQHDHAWVGLAPAWRIAFALVIPYLAHYARLLASALTVLYWLTRQTTTGISVGGTSLIVAGEVFRNVVTSWTYYWYNLPRHRFRVFIWFILLFPEVLQLRLILPYKVKRRENSSTWRPSSWYLDKMPPTGREQRSAALSLTKTQLVVLATVVSCAAYAVYNQPTLLIRASHSDGIGYDTNPAQYPGSRMFDRYSEYNADILFRQGEQDLAHYTYRTPELGHIWRKFMLLPLAQALLSTGQVAQLIMNFRSRTFAGNYPLACAFKAIALLRVATPFIAGSTHYDGVYLSATAQVALVLAEAAQALVYPRVDQEIEGEERKG